MVKYNIGILFGGKSVEHDISIISAMQVIEALKESNYHVYPIFLTNENKMYSGKIDKLKDFKNVDKLISKLHEITFTHQGIYLKKRKITIDIMIPIVHGLGVEDGTVSGVLDIYQIPYPSSGVISSAICQEKAYLKDVLHANGINTVNYVWLYDFDYLNNRDVVLEKIKYPVIIKPATLGSSIGIQKATNEKELDEGLSKAFLYTNKVIVEDYISNMKEFNCSVMGDYQKNVVSDIEEVNLKDGMLSFNDKYQNQSMKNMRNKVFPANISEELTIKIKEISQEVFRIIGASGIIRIDFIVEEQKIYVNEVNTIPGSLAFYLWKGMKMNDILACLIRIARKKETELRKLKYVYNSKVLSNTKFINK